MANLLRAKQIACCGCQLPCALHNLHGIWQQSDQRLISIQSCCPGKVASISHRPSLLSHLCTQSGILYPVVVRFNTVNYAGVSTNNYGLNEVEAA